MRLKLPIWMLILSLIFGAFLGGGGVFLYGHRLSDGTRPSAPDKDQVGPGASFGKVRPAGAPAAVAALGRLAPQGDVIDLGGLMGERLSKLTVQEGDWVEEGAVLGYLDSHDERQAERDTIAAQLDEARKRLQADTAYADALIQEARVAVEQARQLDPLDIESQEARVQLLESEQAASQADLNRLRSLSAGSVPQQQIDQQVQAVRRFQQDLIAARAVLAKARAGLAFNRQRTNAQLQAAEASKKKAEAAAQIESLTHNLVLADARLERTILKAPGPARVLRVLARPGERVDQKPIVKLADTRVMYAVVEVYETDVLWVKPGQRAQVTSPALPTAITGIVERVGQMIYKNDVLSVDPAAAADARVVEVRVRLDAAQPAAELINLQVDVMIDLHGPAQTGS